MIKVQPIGQMARKKTLTAIHIGNCFIRVAFLLHGQKDNPFVQRVQLAMLKIHTPYIYRGVPLAAVVENAQNKS